MNDKISSEEEARQAAYAAHYGEPCDTYTWARVVDKVWPIAVAAVRAEVAAEIREVADRKRVPKSDPDANAYRRIEANILDLMANRIDPAPHDEGK